MDNYISLEAMDILITDCETTSNRNDKVHTMISNILGYCFPMTMNYGVVFDRSRTRLGPYRLMYRIQHYRPAHESGIVDLAWVEVPRLWESVETSLEHLGRALERAITEHGRCWAIVALGTSLTFYEYHHHLPANDRLFPWCPPGRETNTFHIRHDCETIDWMFDHMRQNHEPPAR